LRKKYFLILLEIMIERYRSEIKAQKIQVILYLAAGEGFEPSLPGPEPENSAFLTY